jgi:hypothetical protein|tara:strand:- start:56 stop:172 length:117 start_codon:yes stop_codon:yes gene_type:complete
MRKTILGFTPEKAGSKQEQKMIEKIKFESMPYQRPRIA